MLCLPLTRAWLLVLVSIVLSHRLNDELDHASHGEPYSPPSVASLMFASGPVSKSTGATSGRGSDAEPPMPGRADIGESRRHAGTADQPDSDPTRWVRKNGDDDSATGRALRRQLDDVSSGKSLPPWHMDDDPGSFHDPRRPSSIPSAVHQSTAKPWTVRAPEPDASSPVGMMNSLFKQSKQSKADQARETASFQANKEQFKPILLLERVASGCWGGAHSRHVCCVSQQTMSAV